MMPLRPIFILACLVIGSNAIAEEVHIKPQTQGDVEFVSGGVGEHEQKAMRAMQGKYNLHIVLAVKGTGEYVADAKIKIMDAQGKTVLDTVSAGPDFFAKLSPGHYSLVADRDGHMVKEAIMIPHKHGLYVVADFPKEKGD
jgi:hypothetical protein